MQENIIVHNHGLDVEVKTWQAASDKWLPSLSVAHSHLYVIFKSFEVPSVQTTFIKKWFSASNKLT